MALRRTEEGGAVITLKTLAQATAQEIFDQSVKGVLAQGVPAVQGGCCQYRTDDGLACAVGMLLSDEDIEYLNGASDSKFIGSWGWLVRYGAVPPENEKLIAALQRAHDIAAIAPDLFRSDFLYMARKVAKRFNLEMPDDHA